MKKKDKHLRAEECTHCHACQNSCEFLKKYNIDIGDTERLKELAYHCFLCGRCSAVCPEQIDGRNYILNLRREAVEKNGGRFPEKGYGMLLAEKKNYIYQNYRHATGKSVLFPGCNFPSFYPKTTKKLAELLQKQGIGMVYDCCGKPVAELGLRKEEEAITERINRRLSERQIEEVIMVCPNCYHFLKPRLKVKVTDIYEKLFELGIGKKDIEGGRVFLPCPDREEKEILSRAGQFLAGELEPVKGAQCCGLGGCASVKEQALSKGMAAALKCKKEEKLYSYCASCSGNLARSGCENVSHILTEILETYERPDTKKSAFNRMKMKFI